MKCLVTGGAGFLGSHVTRELLDLGHDVVVLDDLSGGCADNVPPEAKFVQGSILDEGLVDSLFDRRRFDHVFHLAAYAAEGLSHFIKRFNYHNNLIGSVNLINAAINHDVKWFVFTSSIAVYGRNQVPMREEMSPRPEDPYGIAKLAVEQDLACSRTLSGLKYTIFRPHNVYGEHQNLGDPYRNVIGIFMNRILGGEPLEIFGDGAQTRAFSYVKPVASVIARAPQTPGTDGEIFNVGADRPYTINELAHRVCAAMGVEPNLVHLPSRHEVKHAYATHDKANAVFGAPPSVDLTTGLQRMAAWAQLLGPQWPAPFAHIEVAKNLPPSWAEQSANPLRSGSKGSDTRGLIVSHAGLRLRPSAKA